MATKGKDRILFIVESPNKVATIRNILPDNYIVMASVGHVVQIADGGKFWNSGIDVANNFKPNYKVSEDKKDIVQKLKEQVAVASHVILATDGDREGEVIAYTLIQQLKLKEKDYDRITYHEITKSAIMKALENPRKIDRDMVDAGISRSVIDKLLGYGLSPVARGNIGARSVGRCQSAGLKLVVDREKEILNFKPQTYFDLYLHFSKNKSDFTAKYIGTAKKEIKNLETFEKCKEVADRCKKNKFSILAVENKDSLENPKPPFITSTFQQEVSRKLGLSVKSAMDAAQKLFEGINVGGKHIPLCTYLRTDSPTYAPEFKEELGKYVKSQYGEKYYAPVKEGKVSETAQDGHEAFRVIDLTMTPEKLSSYISDDKLLKVYKIVYQRTVASSMKPAIIANTIYTIKNSDDRFQMTSKELKFDGYRKVYDFVDKDDDDVIIKETFSVDEELKNTSIESIEKSTKPPTRFNEASFIKELDKQGIGRPSTYATILSVILDSKRNYTTVEDKYITPTKLGMKLIDFLDEKFSSLINLKYTAEMEKDLDLIAKGQQASIDFLNSFYTNLKESIEKVDSVPLDAPTIKCPKCGKDMVIRKGRFGPFYGCSNYPKCKTIVKYEKGE